MFSTAAPASYLWPEPMENVARCVGLGPSVPDSRLPHLSLPDQLFISAVVNIPRPARPWGAITWLSDCFNISRPMVYAWANAWPRKCSGQPPPRLWCPRRILLSRIRWRRLLSVSRPTGCSAQR